LLGCMAMTGCQNKEKEEAPPTDQTRTITDMAGRKVTVPSVINKVYATSPVGSTLMYTVNDKKMIGLNYDLYEEEKEYTTDYYQNLPNLGGWFGQGKTGNVEEIIKIKPDVVLSSGLNQMAIENADALSKQLGIPVVLFDDGFNSLPATYKFIGDLTGDSKQTDKLSAYCKETIASAKKITDTIKPENKTRIYYAEETEGLNTDPAGSSHAQLIEICGGVNVAQVEMQQGYGRSAVTMEQVLAWNPDFIVACVDNGYAGSDCYNKILSDPAWSTINAEKNKEVFQTPTIPFNWFDRPPSVNTVIGVKWFQNLLYPDLATYNIKEEAKEFYKLFYHVDVDDADLDKILDKTLSLYRRFFHIL
ncbi:MAG: ABC transporter substrate-binding protein, partial [Anaerovorax sp.]